MNLIDTLIHYAAVGAIHLFALAILALGVGFAYAVITDEIDRIRRK